MSRPTLSLAVVLAFLSALTLASPAGASLLTYNTVAGSDSDGPLAGSITFTPVSGGIEIGVTNTETGTFAKGQAISSISFTITGLSDATDFTMLTGLSYTPSSGTSWTSSDGTSFSDTSSAPPINSIDHWGFDVTGANVLLATASSPVAGAGNPQYMILPASGTAGNGSSLANSNFDPYIIGTADFFLTVPGVTTNTVLSGSNFTSVSVGFGTGPDTTLAANVVPEPATLSVCAAGSLVLLMRRRTWRALKTISAEPI